ncbi:MAG: hypothetical protein KIT68_06405, partial [Phycisphaeraceae bacterium]|nr:hypothetical protein [Phycisphaeraceae bacterium]
MIRNAITWSVLGVLAATGTASAQLSYAGGTYGNTFDSLASSGTGNAWTNNVTFTGWHLFQSAGLAITTYNAGDGSSNAGNFYSFGSSGTTERALGGVGAGGTDVGWPAAGRIAG